jgi:hypothetical protein
VLGVHNFSYKGSIDGSEGSVSIFLVLDCNSICFPPTVLTTSVMGTVGSMVTTVVFPFGRVTLLLEV